MEDQTCKEIVEVEERLMKYLTEYVDKSHQGIATTISGFGADLKEIKEGFEKLDIETLNKMTSGYKGVAFISGVITGLAGVLLAFGAIVEVAKYFIRSVK